MLKLPLSVDRGVVAWFNVDVAVAQRITTARLVRLLRFLDVARLFEKLDQALCR